MKLSKEDALLLAVKDKLINRGWSYCDQPLSGLFVKNGCLLVMYAGKQKRENISEFGYEPDERLLVRERRFITGVHNHVSPRCRVDNANWHLEKHGCVLSFGNLLSTCYKLYYGDQTEKQELAMEKFITLIDDISERSEFGQFLFRMEQIETTKIVTKSVASNSDESLKVGSFFKPILEDTVGLERGQLYVVLGMSVEQGITVCQVDLEQKSYSDEVIIIPAIDFVNAVKSKLIQAMSLLDVQTQALVKEWTRNDYHTELHPLLDKVRSSSYSMRQLRLLNEAMSLNLNFTLLLNNKLEEDIGEAIINALKHGIDVSKFHEYSANTIRYLTELQKQKMNVDHLIGISYDAEETKLIHTEQMERFDGLDRELASLGMKRDQINFVISVAIKGANVDHLKKNEPVSFLKLLDLMENKEHPDFAEFVHAYGYESEDFAYVPWNYLKPTMLIKIRKYFEIDPDKVTVGPIEFNEFLSDFIAKAKSFVFHFHYGFGVLSQSMLMFRDANSVAIYDTNMMCIWRATTINKEWWVSEQDVSKVFD